MFKAIISSPKESSVEVLRVGGLSLEQNTYSLPPKIVLSLMEIARSPVNVAGNAVIYVHHTLYFTYAEAAKTPYFQDT